MSDEPVGRPRTRVARLTIALPVFLVAVVAIYLVFTGLAWTIFAPVFFYSGETTAGIIVGRILFWALMLGSMVAVGWGLVRWVLRGALSDRRS
ncbi:hypothetical protein GCM10009775_22360 [Microbacterium aoyamense]|uniref:Uncharacterized protein n=1 Tax=Microbacterium aoyamense TaxID=344166 RepID=A0ABP5B3T5_9MICO|nr:hypothetical protein [Microbacterium aoyamense]